MMGQTFTTRELFGRKVMNIKKPTKKLGKVHSFIFHPRKRRIIGFTVKRPDAALMFHRSDVFVAIDSFSLDEEGRIIIEDDSQSTGRAACKRFGVEWDECLMWAGMPLMGEDGTRYGRVGAVRFSVPDGTIISLNAEKGATNDAVLGVLEIPAEYILGFQFGEGDDLGIPDEYGEEFLKGSIVVSDKVAELETEGGLAEKAGAASAKAGYAADQVAAKAKPVIEEAAAKAKEVAVPAMKDAAVKAKDAAGKAKEAATPKISEHMTGVRGMFLQARAEFLKGMEGDLDDEASK